MFQACKIGSGEFRLLFFVAECFDGRRLWRRVFGIRCRLLRDFGGFLTPGRQQHRGHRGGDDISAHSTVPFQKRGWIISIVSQVLHKTFFCLARTGQRIKKYTLSRRSLRDRLAYARWIVSIVIRQLPAQQALVLVEAGYRAAFRMERQARSAAGSRAAFRPELQASRPVSFSPLAAAGMSCAA